VTSVASAEWELSSSVPRPTDVAACAVPPGSSSASSAPAVAALTTVRLRLSKNPFMSPASLFSRHGG
jgi:hypothetical protein